MPPKKGGRNVVKAKKTTNAPQREQEPLDASLVVDEVASNSKGQRSSGFFQSQTKDLKEPSPPGWGSFEDIGQPSLPDIQRVPSPNKENEAIPSLDFDHEYNQLERTPVGLFERLPSLPSPKHSPQPYRQPIPATPALKTPEVPIIPLSVTPPPTFPEPSVIAEPPYRPKAISPKSENFPAPSPSIIRGDFSPRKPLGTVDGLPSYEGGEWFKESPLKSDVHALSPLDTQQLDSRGWRSPTPSAEVVARNETISYALKASPEVLNQRYLEFGQLGVLGWCDEFSDLIDAIKTIGYEGNMFTSTRDCGLLACRQILQLRMDVDMQLIILLMSSQVARLRRFLDDATEYDDYPIPNLPLSLGSE